MIYLFYARRGRASAFKLRTFKLRTFKLRTFKLRAFKLRAFKPHTFGYSLLELMVSIAITLVLIAVAAPGFANLISKTEVATQASALHETLYLARNVALTRQKIVHICQLNTALDKCSSDYSSGRSWANGWIVFVDVNENNELDGNDDIIRQLAFKAKIGIVLNQRGRLRFFPDGSARSAGFYFCDKLEQAFKHVYLLHSGRARLTTKLSSKNRKKCVASIGGA